MTVNWHQLKNYVRHYFTAKRRGHDVHSPFAYELCEEVFYNTNSFYDFEHLGKLREKLLENNLVLTVEDFGAGSKTFKSTQRKISDIAKRGISAKKQSEIFYRLINYLQPQTIVELGTSLGLNTLYLALANAQANVYTLEGSKALSDFAKQLAAQEQVSNINFITGKFETELPALLNELQNLDLFYVDGNHTYEATLNYFKQGLQKKNNASVLVLDDIYWSPGMTKAWEEIKAHPDVTMSIDTFYFGLVFFKSEVKEKVNFKFLI